MASGDPTKAASLIHDDLASMGQAMNQRPGSVVSAKLPANIGGYRMATGDIVMADDVNADAKSFASNPLVATAEQATAYQMLVHEVAHGAAPHYTTYQLAGALVEEVTTEVVSRWYMRTKFGRRTEAGYQMDVLAMQHDVARICGVSLTDAAGLLEDAALAYRADPKTAGLQTEDEVVDRFVGHFRVPASVRTMLARHIRAVGAAARP